MNVKFFEFENSCSSHTLISQLLYFLCQRTIQVSQNMLKASFLRMWNGKNDSWQEINFNKSHEMKSPTYININALNPGENTETIDQDTVGSYNYVAYTIIHVHLSVYRHARLQ